jgi:hypothetical protein
VENAEEVEAVARVVEAVARVVARVGARVAKVDARLEDDKYLGDNPLGNYSAMV